MDVIEVEVGGVVEGFGGVDLGRVDDGVIREGIEIGSGGIEGGVIDVEGGACGSGVYGIGETVRCRQDLALFIFRFFVVIIKILNYCLPQYE